MTINDLIVFDTDPEEVGVSMMTNADFVAAVFPSVPEGAFAAACSRAGDQIENPYYTRCALPLLLALHKQHGGM